MNTQTKNAQLTTSEKIKLIYQWLSEKKALEPVCFDLEEHLFIAEGLVVAGATSVRHGQGLAQFILEMAKEHNFEFLRMEGFQIGSWILIDLNDVLVNILQKSERDLYRLEELYSDAKILYDDRSF